MSNDQIADGTSRLVSLPPPSSDGTNIASISRPRGQEEVSRHRFDGEIKDKSDWMLQGASQNQESKSRTRSGQDWRKQYQPLRLSANPSRLPLGALQPPHPLAQIPSSCYASPVSQDHERQDAMANPPRNPTSPRTRLVSTITPLLRPLRLSQIRAHPPAPPPLDCPLISSLRPLDRPIANAVI